ncbi:hypothetical protein GCM10017788_27170 [Amycolatopsis acidiphila]|nr:hypothetical protein GCM10017788_27170 [Amycolatopsis acidiphila]
MPGPEVAAAAGAIVAASSAPAARPIAPDERSTVTRMNHPFEAWKRQPTYAKPVPRLGDCTNGCERAPAKLPSPAAPPKRRNFRVSAQDSSE